MDAKLDEYLLENPLLKTYLFYVSILVIKMMAMSPLTGRMRYKHKAFANPEDAKNLHVKVKSDENVERVRRAHLNDLENIPIFMVVSLAYIMTNPTVGPTLWLFRAFTAARILHTLVYAVVVVPQPARALSWATGYFITGYMAVKTAMHFF